MLNLPFTRAQMPACFSSSVEAGGMSKTPARGKADCHVWATRRPLRPFTDADPPTRVENPLLGARRPRVYHFSCVPPPFILAVYCRSRLTSTPAQKRLCSPGTKRANALTPTLLPLFLAGKDSFS